VDIGNLVVAEAEHLAQDLVGMFAEQRRTLHLGRRSELMGRIW
jgi:hypothetical protein